MITTTLARIRTHQPCAGGWEKLLKHLGKTKTDDEPLTFATILESNGLADALWCCRVEPQYAREWRLYAVWCARQVQHLMTDQRSLNAIDVAERYANGLATDDELEIAWNGANAAARDAAWAAAKDAAREGVKDAAMAAAWAAAPDAAMDAARTAAWDAAMATARDASWTASVAAVSDAAWDAQSREFLRIVTETEAIE